MEDRSVPATVTVTAFLDQDGSGSRDPGDGPVAGVGVGLTQPDGSVVGGTTGADGTAVLIVAGSAAGGAYSVTASYTAPDGYVLGNLDDGDLLINIPDESAQIGVGIGLSSGSSSADNPPVLAPIGETRITPGQPFSLQVSATDPDDDPITYSASGLPADLHIDPGTGAVTGTLPDDGTYPAGTRIPVSFEADDGRGGTATVSADLLVVAPLPVISMAPVNVLEGSSGDVVFTRTGDTTAGLTVAYTVGGNAMGGTDPNAGADYDSSLLTGTVTFAPGSPTATVTISAFKDQVYDPDEGVELTIYPTDQYKLTGGVGSDTASNTIIDTTTLIHQETFVLTDDSGQGVSVTMTVVYNAPDAPGLYTWTYTVTNTSSTTDWTTFSIPVEGMDTDVGNLSSDIGWAGTVGSDSVSWAGGTPLAPNATATFSFTTAPRDVGPANVSISDGGANVANLPTAPAPRQKAERGLVDITFISSGPITGQSYTLNLTMEVADGSRYTTGPQVFNNQTPDAACFTLYNFLKINGWEVAREGKELNIFGKADSSGTIIGITQLNYSVTADPNGPLLNSPTFVKKGQVDLINDSN